MKHIMTNAYNPEGNGIVERFHQALKDALRARRAGRCWLEHLPWALLGLRVAPKEAANMSAAEAALRAPLQLPGVPGLGVQEAAHMRPVIPSTVRSYADVAAGRPVRTVQWAYVREGQAKGPLAPKYSGPYQVLETGEQATLLQIGERQEWVAPGRLKPHIGEAPVVPALPPRRGRPKKNEEDNHPEETTEDSGV